MTQDILTAVGGIGLFLLGMVILTDGLKDMAGNRMRRFLIRFTSTPTRGAITGAAATAVIQSSSATTVMAVGFVSAGLLTFPQSIGIIFGANIGTTITGWMVAVIGFKLELGLLAMGLLPVSVMLHFFGTRRLKQIGWVLAGFSLLFMGIGIMQESMTSFQGVLTPQSFPDDTLFGRLQLVLIGIAITLVTQSSSAGVATALVALNADAITLPQGAAMVIGMDIGTTFKTALATLGGAAATRRTGYAHVVYNLMTGLFAFLLLTPYAVLVNTWAANGNSTNSELLLVAFHTSFNVIGVLAALPFAGPFARLMVRLVPESGPQLQRRLDEKLLHDPHAAVDAAAATANDIAMRLFAILAGQINPAYARRVSAYELPILIETVDATRRYLERIRSTHDLGATFERHLATLHALDHLHRLAHRCTQTDRIEELSQERHLQRLTRMLFTACAALIENPGAAYGERRLDRLRKVLRHQREEYRYVTLHAAAHRDIDADTTISRLDGIRWLHRVTYHLWRITHHLNTASGLTPIQGGQKQPSPATPGKTQ